MDSITQAASSILRYLYDTPFPRFPQSRNKPPKTERNKEIYERFSAGERAVDLAIEFSVSERRIRWLVTRYKGQHPEL